MRIHNINDQTPTHQLNIITLNNTFKVHTKSSLLSAEMYCLSNVAMRLTMVFIGISWIILNGKLGIINIRWTMIQIINWIYFKIILAKYFCITQFWKIKWLGYFWSRQHIPNTREDKWHFWNIYWPDYHYNNSDVKILSN